MKKNEQKIWENKEEKNDEKKLYSQAYYTSRKQNWSF